MLIVIFFHNRWSFARRRSLNMRPTLHGVLNFSWLYWRLLFGEKRSTSNDTLFIFSILWTCRKMSVLCCQWAHIDRKIKYGVFCAYFFFYLRKWQKQTEWCKMQWNRKSNKIIGKMKNNSIFSCEMPQS